MQEEPSVSQPTTESPKQKSTKSKNILLFALVIILLLATAVGAYMYRDHKAKSELSQKQTTIDQLNKKITDLESQVAAAKSSSSTTSTTTTTTSSPSAATLDNIKAAITSGNTAALEGYMASNVDVVVAASEKSGARTPTQAITDLAYLNGSSGWNFALDTATLNSYKSGFYKDYFKANSLVGKASDKKVVVFNFNDQGKINAIFMAASDELLTQ